MVHMKILQMNVWTGRIKGAIERFLRENDFDIILDKSRFLAIMFYPSAKIDSLSRTEGSANALL
jgi:hypothetical protein